MYAAIWVQEALGTAILILLGDGVVANNLLVRSKGRGGGWLMVTIGWGLAVMMGVYVAYGTGAHLNPAVTLGLAAAGGPLYGGNPDLGYAAIPATAGTITSYILAQMVGAIIGAVFVWLTYKKHYDLEKDSAAILGTFSTGPEIRSYGWNFLTELIGTFVLVFVILEFGHTPSGLGPLAVALLIVVIGASLGGPTGYAIN